MVTSCSKLTSLWPAMASVSVRQQASIYILRCKTHSLSQQVRRFRCSSNPEIHQNDLSEQRKAGEPSKKQRTGPNFKRIFPVDGETQMHLSCLYQAAWRQLWRLLRRGLICVLPHGKHLTNQKWYHVTMMFDSDHIQLCFTRETNHDSSHDSSHEP